MPWTFAHPAAILPFRQRLPLAALVIGSVSPDIGYYLGLFQFATFAHTAPGVLLACLPLGAAGLGLVHLLREPVIDLLPQPHRGALRGVARADNAPRASRYALQALGLLLGAATHTVWDSFTHAPGHGVQLMPVLQTPVFELAGRSFRLFNLLQHLSTALGVAALFVVYAGWLRHQPRPPGPLPRTAERLRFMILTACAVLAMAAGAAIAHAQGFSGEGFVFRTAIHGANAFALLFVAAALIGRAARAWRVSHTKPSNFDE